MGFLRGVPLLRPHPEAVWMGIAPSQSDARYPYGHTFSLKSTLPASASRTWTSIPVLMKSAKLALFQLSVLHLHQIAKMTT